MRRHELLRLQRRRATSRGRLRFRLGLGLLEGAVLGGGVVTLLAMLDRLTVLGGSRANQ